MIDLIIPYYNNPEGLQKTLDSVDPNIFYITIIDDHSSIHMYHNPKADRIFRYNENHGPGYARQWGLNKTSNPYVMFIDTGDIFLSKEVQKNILQIVEDSDETDVFSFPYYHKDNLTTDTDNRMHGKVYRREFINKYNVTFCPESSYLDEDIGFNRACRLLTNLDFIDIPVIKQIDDENSLTNKDNSISLYRDQTRSLSLTSIHAIEIGRRNNINVEIEINQIAIALYYWFIRIAAERPQFMQEAWSGAKIFFDYFKKEINPNMLYVGTKFINKVLKYRNKLKFQINVLRFVRDIQKNENLPDNYLT